MFPWKPFPAELLKAVMVDKEPACLKAATRNLQHLGFEDRGKVLKGDLLKDLKWLGAYSGADKYDIIFMGPPYRDIKNIPLSFSGPVLASVAKGQASSLLGNHHAQIRIILDMQNARLSPRAAECTTQDAQ